MKTSIKLIALIAISFFTMLQISCKSDDDGGDECDEAICPSYPYAIFIYVNNENQVPVPLDSYEVINIETGNVLTSHFTPENFEHYRQEGEYPLVSNPIEIGEEKDLLFNGIINNQVVVSSNYKVVRGCCFVNLVSGDVHLVLE
jgi:hypothetical protein